jgi:hypothetical protein
MRRTIRIAAAIAFVAFCIATEPTHANGLLLERRSAVECRHVPIGNWERTALYVEGLPCSVARGLAERVERHLPGLGPSALPRPWRCTLEEIEGPKAEEYYSVQCRTVVETWKHGRWIRLVAVIEVDLEGN